MNSNLITRTVVNCLIKFLRTKEAKDICKQHPKWKELDKREKRLIGKSDYYSCKMFKNVCIEWNEINCAYFVSDSFYQTELLPRLNRINYDAVGLRCTPGYFGDKNYQERFVGNLSFPNSIIHNVAGEYYNSSFEHISKEQAYEIIKKYDKVVVKKSIGVGHGKGVTLVDKPNSSDVFEIYKEDFVVQEILKQHNFLANFNESSVNIVRITTLFWKGRVYVLGAILRIGAPGAFCDHVKAGENNPRIIGLDEEGKLIGPAVDPDNLIKYDNIFGKKIEGNVPEFRRMVQIVTDEHLKYAHHRIIGWDLTLTSDGKICCIEYNSSIPGIVQTQTVLGPIFMKLSERGNYILDEILEQKKMLQKEVL